MSLRQRLRAWWDSDERLGALESDAKAAAGRTAAVEASVADARHELERHQARTVAALEAASTELRRELGGIASGLRALEARLSLTDLDGQRRALRLEESWRDLRAGLEQVHHSVAHQADQLDLLKSSLEVAPSLIEEFLEWKGRHPLSVRPLVSVCVATYNRAQLLVERCLPSVLGQSYPHLEVIVVGDGCTDDTADRIGILGDPRLRFVNLERRGDYPTDPLRHWMVAGTAAVNQALSQARGELITHLDDDDEYVPERLEKLDAFVRDEGCDLAWHPFWYENEDGRWILNDARRFAFACVTTSSVLYRSWFKKIPWDAQAHRLLEPGDWNRFRRLRYLGSVCRRFPEPLLRHYREQRPPPGPAD